ncbi:MAG: protein-disulfide reductase DsbD domain-containing protein [Vicinamibacterales bacterium]
MGVTRFGGWRQLGLAAGATACLAVPAATSQTLRQPLAVTAVPPGGAATVRTAHLTVQAAASVAALAPGDRVTLSVDVTPRPGMHVYAPGPHDYQVVTFTVDDRPWLRVRPLRYPPAEIYHFVPLDERVPTYGKPFTLGQDLAVLATPAARRALAGRKDVTIRGTLEYQACDDRICYAPATVPLEFTLDLAPGSGR